MNSPMSIGAGVSRALIKAAVIISFPAITLSYAGCLPSYLRAATSSELQCPEDKIKLKRETALGIYVTTGCGKTAFYYYRYKNPDPSSENWYEGTWINLNDSLRETASNAISCPTQKLRLRDTSKWNQVVVAGCGHELLLHLVTPDGGFHWEWLIKKKAKRIQS